MSDGPDIAQPAIGSGGGDQAGHGVTAGNAPGRSTPAREQRGRGRARPKHPDRDVKYYTVSANELMIVSATGIVGSAFLYGATHFYAKWLEMGKQPNHDIELLGTLQWGWLLFGVSAILSYAFMGGVVLRIKWESGDRWWRLLF